MFPSGDSLVNRVKIYNSLPIISSRVSANGFETIPQTRDSREQRLILDIEPASCNSRRFSSKRPSVGSRVSQKYGPPINSTTRNAQNEVHPRKINPRRHVNSAILLIRLVSAASTGQFSLVSQLKVKSERKELVAR